LQKHLPHPHHHHHHHHGLLLVLLVLFLLLLLLLLLLLRVADGNRWFTAYDTSARRPPIQLTSRIVAKMAAPGSVDR
jgi:hypothetical protein